jgi:hypothetical protein
MDPELSYEERHKKAAKMERKFTVTLNIPTASKDFISW